ncbi:MAG: YceI family protein [Alphaproteobacteria bacterium]
MKKFLFLAASVCAISYVQPVLAEEKVAVETPMGVESYTFDKAHTQILFFVDHLGFSKSQGEFLDFDGSFNFDLKNPEKSNVDVTINTAGLDMDDEKWNAHMKNADFFDVEKFPTMTFKSTSIEVTGENTANITGDLTLLEVTKPVVLSVKHNKSGKHAFSGEYVSGFSATTTIKRSEFGMKYGLPMIGDDVEVRLEIEGVRSKGEDAEVAK